MTDVLDVRDEYRAQQWALVIQECSASGLSNREFCRLNTPAGMVRPDRGNGARGTREWCSLTA